MEKKRLIVLVVGVVLIGALWMWTSQLESGVENPVEAEDFLRESKEQVAALYQAPREDILEAIGNLSKECQGFFRSLRSLDLTRHQEEFPDLKPLTNGDPCKEVPPALQKLQEHFEKSCRDTKNANQCLVALYYYRAAVTDYFTQSVALEKISDPKILIDKMLANREINPLVSVKAAERLSELEPTLYEARKASVLGRLFMASQSKQLDSKNWSELDSAIERAQELGGESDPELLEAELLGRLFRENQEMEAEERAREISEDYPQEWRGPYYAAWALFKRGNKAEALDFLTEAQKRDPQNKRVSEALEGIKKGDAQPFSGSISFSDLSQYF